MTPDFSLTRVLEISDFHISSQSLQDICTDNETDVSI